MKVKIRDEVYDSEKEPIMLILSDEDKKLIGSMNIRNYKYCIYPNSMSFRDVEGFVEAVILCDHKSGSACKKVIK